MAQQSLRRGSRIAVLRSIEEFVVVDRFEWESVSGSFEILDVKVLAVIKFRLSSHHVTENLLFNGFVLSSCNAHFTLFPILSRIVPAF